MTHMIQRKMYGRAMTERIAIAAARFLRAIWTFGPGILGPVLIVGGLALIYPPAAMIVTGIVLCFLDWTKG